MTPIEGVSMFKKLIVFVAIALNAQLAVARELVVISDLDETLRMANIENKVKAGVKLVTGVKPYEGLRAIFNELKAKNPEVKFYYLSNSYPFLYDGDKWTDKNGFPDGTILQRRLKDKSESFKPRKLKEIAARHPDASFLLFGDNVEHDPKFYRNFLAESQLSDVQVFVRDARLEFSEEPNMTYFQTEAQITDDLNMSQETSEVVSGLAFNKLVPKFLLKNLKKRLIKSCKNPLESCRVAAERRVLEVIDQIRPRPF